MKKIITALLVVFVFCGTAQAQNEIQNITDNQTIASLAKQGLSELNIQNIHLTIVPLSNYYSKISSMSNAKPWGVTVSGNKHTYTIIISLRHESDVGVSFKERIAHELIHVEQGYKDKKHSEKEAYKKQYTLASKLSTADK